jgi:hypothetical protein
LVVKSQGTYDGCWTSLHPDTKFGFVFGTVGKSQRLVYRPEIYYRDTQQFLYDVEKQVIAQEKAGERPKILNPVVLWH